MSDSNKFQNCLRNKLTWVFRFFMILVLAFLILPATYTAFAEDGDFALHAYSEPEESDVSWYQNGDELIVKGQGVITTDSIWNVWRPETAVSLIIEEGITGISSKYNDESDRGFFSNYDQLTTVKLPMSFKAIEKRMFLGCRQLQSIDFGGVEIIGESAFYECISLSQANFEQSHIRKIENSAFCRCESLSNAVFPSTIETIGDYSFNSSGLESIDFGYTQTVGEASFGRCGMLKQISFGESLNSIGESAFSMCGSLETVKLPTALEVLGDGAFSYCEGLKSVDLSSASIKTICAHTFENSSSIINIYFPNSLESIEDGQFYWWRGGNTYEGEGVFSSCEKLTSLDFSNTALKYIGTAAFCDCDDLEQVNLPSTIEVIGEGSFYKNEKLVQLDLKKTSLREIGDYAFSENLSLENVVLPSTVEIIGCGTFSKCKKLMQINLEGLQLKTIGDEAFNECPLSLSSKIVFPDTLKYIGIKAFASTDLRSVVLNNIETIGDLAFRPTSLTSAELNNIGTIGDYAFAYTCLPSVIINNVGTIGNHAFAYCNLMTSAEINNVGTVGDYAFDHSALQLAVINNVRNIGTEPFDTIFEVGSTTYVTSIPEVEFKGSAPETSEHLYGSVEKYIYPADDPSWTFNIRKSMFADNNNIYMRNSNGTLTRAFFIPSSDTVSVTLGSSDTKQFSLKDHLSSVVYEFTASYPVKVMLSADVPFGGSFEVKIRDQYGDYYDASGQAYYLESYYNNENESVVKHSLPEVNLDKGKYFVYVDYGNIYTSNDLTGTASFTIELIENKDADNSSSGDKNEGDNNGDDNNDGPNTDNSSGESNGVKFYISDPSVSQIKVVPNFNGPNISEGDEASIELKQVETPQIIAANMSNEPLGVYEINLFVDKADGSGVEQIHDGFGSLDLSFPVDGHEGGSVTIHHLHHDDSGLVAASNITKHPSTVYDGFADLLEVEDLSTFAVEAPETDDVSGGDNNGLGENASQDDNYDQSPGEVDSGQEDNSLLGNNASIGNDATQTGDSSNDNSKGLLKGLANTGDKALIAGLAFIVISFTIACALTFGRQRKRR